MAIKLDAFVTKLVGIFGDAQHELRKEEERRLDEFFVITRGDDGHITELKPRDFTLDLIDRKGYVNAMDMIQEATSIAIDKARLKFETDLDIIQVKIDGKDDFEIHTNVKRGLFKSHSTLEMEIFVKGIKESEGMRVLRAYFHQRLTDELAGFSKVEREPDNPPESNSEKGESV